MELCTSSFLIFFTHPLFLHIRTCWICCGSFQDLSGVYLCLFPALREEYDKGKMGGWMLALQCVVGNSGNGRKYVLQSTGIFTGVLRIGVSNLWWFWTWLHMDPDEIWPRVPLELHQSHANMSISVDGNATSVLSRFILLAHQRRVCESCEEQIGWWRWWKPGTGSKRRNKRSHSHLPRWQMSHRAQHRACEWNRTGRDACRGRARARATPGQNVICGTAEKKRAWYVKCVELRASSRVWPSNSLASNSLNPDVFTACLMVRSPRSSVAWVPRLWRLAWLAHLADSP